MPSGGHDLPGALPMKPYSQSAHAGKVALPSVPPELKVLDGTHPFLVGHAIGTQNYFCVASTTADTGVACTLFTPEATLFNDDGDQIITHFFSPNLDPNAHDPNVNPAVKADAAIRATWVNSKDGRTVWAKVQPNGSVQNPGAVALLDVVGHEDGLTGGNILSKTTQIQRLNTTGSVPTQGCDWPANLGHQAFADYTADYFFYTND
jgi:Protein of unknown function (DUF3455)